MTQGSLVQCFPFGKAIFYPGIFFLSHTHFFPVAFFSSLARFGARDLGFGVGVGGGVWRDPPLPDLEERSGEAGRPGGGCGRGAMRPAAVAPPGGWWRRPVGPGWGGGDDGHGGGAAPVPRKEEVGGRR